MTENDQTSANQPPAAQPSSQSLANALVDQIFGAIDKTDEQAAARRVTELRLRHPDATAEELAERLIRQRCLQAGAVGAVTSGATIIPGLGSVATLVFGVAADLQMTYKIQSELVLELAAIYDRPIRLEDKRYVVALVTGMSAGANQLVRKAGTELAERATQRLAGKALAKSLPVIGIAASGGINVVSTYLIARRAQAYFRQDATALIEWDDQMRALTGVDELKLVNWLAESAESSWRAASRQLQKAGGYAWQQVKSGANSAAGTVGRWRQERQNRRQGNPPAASNTSSSSQ